MPDPTPIKVIDFGEFVKGMCASRDLDVLRQAKVTITILGQPLDLPLAPLLRDKKETP